MSRFAKFAFASLAAMTVAAQAQAVVVNWADLTSAGNGVVQGTITAGGETIDVSYRGGYAFAQTSGGTNYWSPDTAYTSGVVENAPSTPDIIALGDRGTRTITFSKTVSDVYLALVSWNGNSAIFDQAFQVISQGQGYWGNGTFTAVTPYSFVANGELHGVIRFTGAFDQVTFTDGADEYWHGFQIGIAGLAPPPQPGVPEPATWAMMLTGFGMVGAAARRRKAALAAA
jgi:hypothetical protein